MLKRLLLAPFVLALFFGIIAGLLWLVVNEHGGIAATIVLALFLYQARGTG